MKKKRLGRGLGALIGNIDAVTQVSESDVASGITELGIDQIQRGQYQPRQHFDQQALQELADSITAQGIVQPLIVRPEGGHYELIAGERRWRAAQLAGLQAVPVVIRQLDGQSAAAVSLIENIQREGLNPLEESMALMRLIDEFGLTHQQAADSVGRSRVAVTNLLRLLELAEPVKHQVNQGLLGMGHARALLALNPADQIEVGNLIVNRGLSVRETETLVNQTLRIAPAKKNKSSDAPDPDIKSLQDKVSEKLGATVKIKATKDGSGQLIIHFHSNDELNGILQHLKL